MKLTTLFALAGLLALAVSNVPNARADSFGVSLGFSSADCFPTYGSVRVLSYADYARRDGVVHGYYRPPYVRSWLFPTRFYVGGYVGVDCPVVQYSYYYRPVYPSIFTRVYTSDGWWCDDWFYDYDCYDPSYSTTVVLQPWLVYDRYYTWRQYRDYPDYGYAYGYPYQPLTMWGSYGGSWGDHSKRRYADRWDDRRDGRGDWNDSHDRRDRSDRSQDRGDGNNWTNRGADSIKGLRDSDGRMARPQNERLMTRLEEFHRGEGTGPTPDNGGDATKNLRNSTRSGPGDKSTGITPLRRSSPTNSKVITFPNRDGVKGLNRGSDSRAGRAVAQDAQTKPIATAQPVVSPRENASRERANALQGRSLRDRFARPASTTETPKPVDPSANRQVPPDKILNSQPHQPRSLREQIFGSNRSPNRPVAPTPPQNGRSPINRPELNRPDMNRPDIARPQQPSIKDLPQPRMDRPPMPDRAPNLAPPDRRGADIQRQAPPSRANAQRLESLKNSPSSRGSSRGR